MTLRCIPHLRAWLLEEVEFELQDRSDADLVWALDFLSALWAEASLETLLADSSYILQPLAFRRFVIFAARNYPGELAEAISHILEEHAAADLVWPLHHPPSH